MKFEPIIKWTGSKRALSEQIIKYFPKNIQTYYEPFCGSCSILFQLLHSDIKVEKYICGDVNKDLIDFFVAVKNEPQLIFEEYKVRWSKISSLSEIKDKTLYYNQVRSNYNNLKNIHDFIFLTRTSANGLIRYNSKGEFNAPFHLTRDGINPDRFKKIIYLWSDKLNEFNVEFVNCSYDNFKPGANDYVFLDPPYASTSSVYFGAIDFNNFWQWLEKLSCNYSLTFNGKRSEADSTFNVPESTYTSHVYLDGKISSFKRLHKETDYVQESLYIK